MMKVRVNIDHRACDGSAIPDEMLENLATVVYYRLSEADDWTELGIIPPLTYEWSFDVKPILAPGESMEVSIKSKWVTTGVESCDYSNVMVYKRPESPTPTPQEGGGCGGNL